MDFDRDFGVNQVFVEDQYERWRNNPAAVSPEWQQYFARLHGLPTPPTFQASAWSQPAPTPAPGGDGNGHAAIAFPPQTGFELLSIPAPAQERLQAEILQEKVGELINAYRIRGHLFANLDPLGLLQPPPPELEIEHFGLSEEQLDKPFATGDFAAGEGEIEREGRRQRLDVAVQKDLLPQVQRVTDEADEDEGLPVEEAADAAVRVRDAPVLASTRRLGARAVIQFLGECASAQSH